MGVAGGRGAERSSLLFVTGQRLLAEALGTLLNATGSWIVGVVSEDHPDLLEACRAAEPHVVVLDLGTDVPEESRAITLLGHLPDCAVVVLAESPRWFPEAVERGARACVTYSASLEEVRAAIEGARAGRTVVAADDLAAVITGLQKGPAPGERLPSLSARERQILSRIAVGESTRDIAAALDISVATARKHIQNILRKLGVHSKLQAGAYAVKAGLV
jgi:DNA-binding NarL/FixJ family response regulator